MIKSVFPLLACVLLAACDLGPAYTEKQKQSFSQACSDIKGKMAIKKSSISRGSSTTEDTLVCFWKLPTPVMKGAFRETEYVFSQINLERGQFVVNSYNANPRFRRNDNGLLFTQACENQDGGVVGLGYYKAPHCLIGRQYFESLSIKRSFSK